MPLTDHALISAERSAPRIVELWFGLQPLRSTVRFMNTGAHPDDETSAMLAAIGLRDGLNLSYACANRGEGGQNDIGTETTRDLGVLRTAEMERAADVLNLNLYWLSETPQDSIFDFGFSKSGEETLAKWGRDHALRRFVTIVRAERPDIICPTFLNVPGQHGHHRAMTLLAHEVMDAADDPDMETGQPRWRASKLYLPAWSGAGLAYDDDVPPPRATLTVRGTGSDPVTGWSYEHIAQHSRAYHRTQGMGRWLPSGSERDWPLHLSDTRVSGPDTALTSGLPTGLADLGIGGQAAPVLRAAQQDIDAAVAAFPLRGEVLKAASAAVRSLRAARAVLTPTEAEAQGHRLDAKLDQLAKVIRIASGVEARCWLHADLLRPGARSAFTLDIKEGEGAVDANPVWPEGWVQHGTDVHLTEDAAPNDPYPSSFHPLDPPLPRLRVTISAHDITTHSHVPLEQQPIVAPEYSLELRPGAVLVNTRIDPEPVEVSVRQRHPVDLDAQITPPAGWLADTTENGLRLQPPHQPKPGRYTLPVFLGGKPAHTVRVIEHPHSGPRLSSTPSVLRLCVVEAELPPHHIGYIGAGRDRVGHWLSALGARVTEVDDAMLANPAMLEVFDTLVIGIFTLKYRGALGPAMPDVHAWVRAGGTLLTLYHRPWDNWDAAKTPPKPIEIGQPSLRWRVTDEKAEVTHLVPEHPLLNSPNRIGPEDWDGWHKERGLYFAKSWDPCYVPLLSMADPGEDPHRGALLTAQIGAGRHTHTSLILHHQMENLVPGAFRLMANLVAKRG
ncbi:MAG: PIG-L family deacetylase [Pseudomonadota bacterium]